MNALNWHKKTKILKNQVIDKEGASLFCFFVLKNRKQTLNSCTAGCNNLSGRQADLPQITVITRIMLDGDEEKRIAITKGGEQTNMWFGNY